MKTSIQDLPDEIIEDILVSLPVKSLLRFMSVSKSWHSLINEPDFARSNLKHQRLYNSAFLTYCSPGYCLRPQIVEYLEDQKLTPRELDWPFEVTDQISMKFQCEGIVLCFLDNDDGLLFLWNPLLNKYKILPDLELDFEWDFERSWMVIGFGYDSTINDYKIIILVKYAAYSQAIMVLNLKSRMWRNVYDQDSRYHPIDHCRGYIDSVTLNGGLYFLARANVKSDLPRRTLSLFDLAEETIKELPLPSGVKEYDIGDLNLRLMGGLLYLCRRLYHLDMWVMKEEGCWLKFLSTSLYDFKNPQLMSLHFTRDGELVIYSGAGRAVVIKGIENGSCRKIEEIEVCEDYRWPNNYKFVVHQSSLISP